MGIFDKAKEALGEHGDKVDQAIERAGDLIDEKTGDKYVGHVDKGQEFAKERLAGLRDDKTVPPAQPEQPV